MPVKKSTAMEPVQISQLDRGYAEFYIVGETPFYSHAMSAKAKRDLLLGTGKKTAAEKKATMKHNPEEEFRDSVYTLPDGPTLIGFPAGGVKSAMATAALETEGVNKTTVQRLVFLPSEMIPIWGVPLMRLDVVRSADQNRTPDIRSRCFLAEWCSVVEVTFIKQSLTPTSMAALLMNAGLICGLGDFRQEKGRGNYGTFRVVDPNDADWLRISKLGGRKVQEAALRTPICANADTEALMEAIATERKKRSQAPALPVKSKPRLTSRSVGNGAAPEVPEAEVTQ